MRPSKAFRPRRARPVHVAAGIAILAIPASAAVALAAPASDTKSAVHVSLDRQQLRYGQQLAVSGSAPASGGQRVALEFSPAGGSWREIASTTVGRSGVFRLVASLQRSGSVRVVGAATTPSVKPRASAAIAPSPPQSVAVAPRLTASTGSVDALTGHPFDVRGRLLPGGGGRIVKLQGSTGHGWSTLTTARTGSAGHFDLRYTAGATGQQRLRVKFPGDRLNSRASVRTGQLTVYRESVASWYTDGGGTACGFHAGYGVANRDLPCGTKVTFSYHGRSVTATVDDRGPFVGGRDWDLNQNTAAALGFDGVAAVWSSR